MLVCAALCASMEIGCSHAPGHFRAAASAPSLSGEGVSHARNLADPNAPFVLIDRTSRPAAQQREIADGAVPLCIAANLSVSEVSASMNENSRSIKLALVNRGGSACRLAGFPAVALLDDKDNPVAGIAIQQTGDAEFAAHVVDSPAPVMSQTPTEVVIPPRGAATFHIGWSTGEQCPVVSRFMLSAPGIEASVAPEDRDRFIIDRLLIVCDGRVRVTALATDSTL